MDKWIWTELNEFGTILAHIEDKGKWYSFIIEHYNEKFPFGIYGNW